MSGVKRQPIILKEPVSHRKAKIGRFQTVERDCRMADASECCSARKGRKHQMNFLISLQEWEIPAWMSGCIDVASGKEFSDVGCQYTIIGVPDHA